VVIHEVLARRITSWNLTKRDGTPQPINATVIKHLPSSDLDFLMERIQPEEVEELSDPKGETSSTTSSPSPTASPSPVNPQ
jgi:hypothetical protein